MERNAVISDVDADVVTIGGSVPPLKMVNYERLHAFDLRDNPHQFGEDGNQRVTDFVKGMPRPWAEISCPVCLLEDTIGSPAGIFKDGLVVMGTTSRLNWEKRHAEAAESGERLDTPVAELSFEGRSGYVVNRSGFNYYHFFSDMLFAVENFYKHREALALDRVIIGMQIDEETGFQKQLLELLFPEFEGRFVFEPRPVYCETIAYNYLLPGMVSRDEAGKIQIRPPRGTGGFVVYTSLMEAMRRASAMSQAHQNGTSPRITLVSRQKTKTRLIVNEDELFARLEPLGCRRVFFEDLSLIEKMQVLSGTEVLICAHGAGLVNAAFCPPGIKVIELSARQYLQRASWLAKYAVAMDFDWNVAVCDEDGDSDQLQGNYGNDLRLSETALDWCEAACRPGQLTAAE